MARLVLHVELGQSLGPHPFLVQLLHEGGERVGEVEHGGARRQRRVGLDQPLDQRRQLQAPPQARRGGGQIGNGDVGREISDQPHAGGEDGRAGREGLLHAALEAAGVHEDGDLSQRFGRAVHALQQPGGDLAGHIRARWKSPDAHARAAVPASSASAGAIPAGVPTSRHSPS